MAIDLKHNGNIEVTNGVITIDGSPIGGGGGLEGTQYVFVAANGTPTENAAELQSAYDTAKTMSPSATNIITVICGTGTYSFPNNNPFTLDTEFIDLVSLTGNRDVFLTTVSDSNNLTTLNNFIIDTDNVFVKGIDGSKDVWVDIKGPFLESGQFTIIGNLPNLICENCAGGRDSFGISGTASGTFINCQGGDFSFGTSGTASGTFINCQSGFGSFGGVGGAASGTFIDCQGGFGSFGRNGTASGTFTNCQGGDESFGRNGTASGTFTNCQGGDGSFGGNFGTASGTFTNCQGGNASFGGFGTLSGQLYYCRLTAGTFQTVSGAGVTRLCIDGNNNENNQG